MKCILAYPLSIRIIERFELHHIWMTDDTHDLQFAILLVSVFHQSYSTPCQAHLEALILKNAFDSCIFSVGSQLGLENHSEGAIAYDLALRVLHLPCLARQAILHFLTNDLCMLSAVLQYMSADFSYLPPIRKLVKPAGRFCVDILTRQNDGVPCGYREYGGLELSSL